MVHPILRRVSHIGGQIFTAGDFNLNIVGIRSNGLVANTFDDEIHVIYKDAGQWFDRWWPVTTDPGVYYLNHPMSPAGTAAVVADRQYRGVWELGEHRSQYPALVQTGGRISVHRDDNGDSRVDYRDDNIASGYFGINCHRASRRDGGSTTVDRWSAGCQVFADPDHFEEFMSICRRQQAERGWGKFTYTLLKEW